MKVWDRAGIKLATPGSAVRHASVARHVTDCATRPGIILKRKRKLVALLLLPYRCFVAVDVLWLFLAVPWVGLQCVIVAFPDHTHFLIRQLLQELPDLGLLCFQKCYRASL